MLRQLLLISLAALALSLALVPPAAAKGEPAPQVDPNSPAGTEYQLPTERARHEASGDRSTGSAGSSSARDAAPLFGAGVEHARPAPARKPSAHERTGTSTATRTEQPDLGTGTAEIVRGQAASPDGGVSGLVAVGGGAAGVLLLGGLTGLAWRRRSMRG
jgi:hypothetical protein